MDGQIINLLVVKKFINPRGTFICHDLQFPLPFADNAFGCAVSSTCLPEVPCHASMVREAVRVTRRDGHVIFDLVWATPAARVDPKRHYRFLQNEFEDLQAIVTLLDRCAAGRQLLLFVVDKGQCKWAHGTTDIQRLVAQCPDALITVIVSATTADIDTARVELTEEEKGRLYLNPLYENRAHTTGEIDCVRVYRGRIMSDHGLVPPNAGCLPMRFKAERGELADDRQTTALYRCGLFVLLPAAFSAGLVPFRELCPKEWVDAELEPHR